MSKAPDTIKIACPKCRKQFDMEIGWPDFCYDDRCPVCDYPALVEQWTHQRFVVALEELRLKRLGK